MKKEMVHTSAMWHMDTPSDFCVRWRLQQLSAQNLLVIAYLGICWLAEARCGRYVVCSHFLFVSWFSLFASTYWKMVGFKLRIQYKRNPRTSSMHTRVKCFHTNRNNTNRRDHSNFRPCLLYTPGNFEPYKVTPDFCLRGCISLTLLYEKKKHELNGRSGITQSALLAWAQ